MAHIYRLVVCVALLLVSFASHAWVPMLGEWYNNEEYGGFFSSAEGACSALNDKPAYAQKGWKFTATNIRESKADCVMDDGRVGAYAYRNAYCPAGSTSQGGQCICEAGLDEYNGMCVQKCAADEVRQADGSCKKKLTCPPGTTEQGGACLPENCTGEEVRDPVTGLCVKPPDCSEGETRVNGKCQKTKCPKKGTSAGDGWGMSGEADEFFCLSFGVGTSSSLSGGDGTLYCMVHIKNDTMVAYDDVRYYEGYGKYTGAECRGGTSNKGQGTGSGGGTGGGSGGDGGGSGTGTGGDGGGTGSGTGGGGTGGSGSGGGTGGTGGTGSGGTGTGDGGTGGTGTGGSNPEPTPPSKDGGSLPKPPSVPPDVEGKCPEGSVRKGDGCYYPTPAPTPPDKDGKCPSGSVKIKDMCVYPEPSGTGGGGGSGGGSGGGKDEGDGEGTGFGGSCKAGFACEGDALQCAMAREQYARNCQAFENPSPESQLYDKEKGKEGKQTDGLPGNETFDLTSRIDRSDVLGGGACIQDKQVVVWGRAITLPFSGICPHISMLGNLLVAVSLLLAARIVGRG